LKDGRVVAANALDVEDDIAGVEVNPVPVAAKADVGIDIAGEQRRSDDRRAIGLVVLPDPQSAVEQLLDVPRAVDDHW
jgi:hypothetical protein